MYKQVFSLKPFYFEKQIIILPKSSVQQYSTNTENDNEKKTESFRWTKPWSEIEGVWQSNFKLFAPKKGISLNFMKFLTSPKDVSPSGIKSWWKNVERNYEIQDQMFLKDRHDFLGNDLAAAHFIVFRGGSVRFGGKKQWLRMDENDECKDLPKFFIPDLQITDIDCSNMKIHYEGLQNLYRLKKLTWLSFKNCKTIDDFCLDRISGEYGDTLKYLDISGCSITERGLGALYRCINLETLVVSDMKRSTAFELTCAMLEELYPKLVVQSVE